MDVYSALVPISFFIFYWKSSFFKIGLRILFSYAAFIFLINLILYWNQGNKLLYALSTVVESIAFISFLYLQIKNKRLKRALLTIGSIVVLFDVIFPFLQYEIKLIDSIQIGIETIVVLVFSFYYLYEKANDTTTLYIYSSYTFWIVIGMVIYLSGSFFIYLFADSLSMEEVSKYWFVTNILSILKNIFFTIGIVVNSKPLKKMPWSDLDFSSLN